MTPAQIFANVGERFRPEKAKDVDMSIVFDLTGDNGGQWSIIVNNGTYEMKKEAIADPTATLIMDADDYVAMTNGDLNPMMAFMTGKVKVDGELDSVLKFQSIFGL